MTHTITLDNSSPEALAHALRQLDDTLRNTLAQTLREIENEGNEALILDTVREVLARDLPGRQAAGVLFSSSLSQCGFFYYLDITAQVLCDDGTITDVDFDDLDTALEEQWDEVGINSTVLVDLRRGTVAFLDCVPDLHRELNIPAPAAQASSATP
ncbi:hypothetical protein [Lentzea sp. NBRC 102530]|uniref:hypothetical protein n=1 Tax=Lentzea sp. NBRC 102530 TaxID=3032201 RepID=UPI00249FDDD3|nr:hypothetical protein [Lentzea sp. NBRC 102530]GLY54867.1 hypothetical protein Lesp01_85220 [Lentzea sp. NBRC 102530]